MTGFLKRLLLFPGIAVLTPIETIMWLFTGGDLGDRLVGPFIDWVDEG
jgi:hypothetical protein